ncbi:MAG: hypothetical protein II828_06345 [Clostridia bacterium]|nr:hypothetical protein [Clostridia bacterium]
MNQEQFCVLLPYISADLVAMIAREKQIPEEQAMRILYDSQLYAALEDEMTKIWHYSTPMLYTLLTQEEQTGIIDYPDV